MMKVDQLEITLVGGNYGRKHTFNLMRRDNDIAFFVGEKLIATLAVTTMTKDVRDDDGDYHTKPSDNFYIDFVAVEAVCKRECSAMVFVEPLPVQDD